MDISLSFNLGESWHTAKDKGADNNSNPLPRQYTGIIKKIL